MPLPLPNKLKLTSPSSSSSASENRLAAPRVGVLGAAALGVELLGGTVALPALLRVPAVVAAGVGAFRTMGGGFAFAFAFTLRAAGFVAFLRSA